MRCRKRGFSSLPYIDGGMAMIFASTEGLLIVEEIVQSIAGSYSRM